MSLLPLLISRREGIEGKGPGGTTGCILWLRTDKAHSSAPDVVNLTGINVNTWYDQSGLGNHASASGSARPDWITGVVNCPPAGLMPGVLFDGVNDFLLVDPLKVTEFGEGTLDGRPSAMMFVVFRGADQTAGLLSIRHMEDGSTMTDGMNIQIQPSTVRDEVTIDADCGGESITPITIPLITGLNYNDSSPHLAVNMFDADVATSDFRLRVDCTTEVPLTLPDATRLYLGSNEINIGRFGPGGLYFSGYLFEVLIYSNASDSTRATVESYLCNKWCI